MKVYVLNIERNKTRKRHIEGQLRRLGVNYETVPAIDPMHMSDSDLKLTVKNSQEYSKVDACNMLSHCRVYTRMQAEKDEYALILEDEVLIVDKMFKDILDCLHSNFMPKNVTLLHYYWEHEDPLILQKKSPVQHIMGLHHDYFMYMPNETHSLKGSLAYVISKVVAKDILKLNSPALVSYSDSWMMYFRYGIISGIDCIQPLPIVYSPLKDTEYTSFSLLRSFVGKFSKQRHPARENENRKIIKTM
jgi:GR25 family glycosyltransferase involved in LPS biosynthesis